MLLVTGVSGVGKTFTITAAIASDPAIERLSASAILRELGRPVTDLTTSSADENQKVLMSFLRRMDAPRRSRSVFDGHAVLETDGGPWQLPIEIIDAMRFGAIAMIYANPAELGERRLRKGKASDKATVRALQDLEERHSIAIANELMLPYTRVRSGDGQALAIVAGSLRRSNREGSR